MSARSALESLAHQHGPGQHEAVFYAGRPGFLDATVPFLREGADAGEPVLVALVAEKLGAVRAALGPAADAVTFVDMGELGTNPARIIPAWREFASRNAGRKMRGIGEPIWAERSAAELLEAQLHERLLNVAFDRHTDLLLRCPYDLDGLPAAVIAEARRSHPVHVAGSDGSGAHSTGGHSISAPMAALDADAAAAFAAPLPPPPAEAQRHVITGTDALGIARDLLTEFAFRGGAEPGDVAEARVAVTELVANSLAHASTAALTLWATGDRIVVEVRDDGTIRDPMVGRRTPSPDASTGRGLWTVNQLCRLTQVRSGPGGTTARLHLAVRGSRATPPTVG